MQNYDFPIYCAGCLNHAVDPQPAANNNRKPAGPDADERDVSERRLPALVSPCTKDLRAPGMIWHLGLFYDWLGLSDEACVDWILEEIYGAVDRPLIGPDGEPVELMQAEPVDDFGEDGARTLAHFMAKAAQPPRESYHGRNINILLWLWLARRLWLEKRIDTHGATEPT